MLVSNLVWQCDVQAPVDCHDFEDGLAQQQWPQLQGAAAHQQWPACTHKHRQHCVEHTEVKWLHQPVGTVCPAALAYAADASAGAGVPVGAAVRPPPCRGMSAKAPTKQVQGDPVVHSHHAPGVLHRNGMMQTVCQVVTHMRGRRLVLAAVRAQHHAVFHLLQLCWQRSPGGTA